MHQCRGRSLTASCLPRHWCVHARRRPKNAPAFSALRHPWRADARERGRRSAELSARRPVAVRWPASARYNMNTSLLWPVSTFRRSDASTPRKPGMRMPVFEWAYAHGPCALPPDRTSAGDSLPTTLPQPGRVFFARCRMRRTDCRTWLRTRHPSDTTFRHAWPSASGPATIAADAWTDEVGDGHGQ